MREEETIRRLGGYREGPAPSALAPWADVVWDYRRRPGTPPLLGEGHRILPHEGVNLLLTWWWSPRGRPVEPVVLLQGPVRTIRFFQPEEGRNLLALRVRSPWARTVLGVDPTELADRAVDIGEVRGRAGHGVRNRLLDALQEERPMEGMFEVVEEGWNAGGVDRRAAELADRGLRLVTAGSRADRAAAVVGITPRHLRRVVVETTGVPPRYHHRIRRLDRVVARADATRSPVWSRLALEGGFCDQAHLNREMRALAGLTPVGLHVERRRQVDGP